MTRTVPRLAIATDLRCNSGTIVGFLSGVGGTPHVLEDARSYQSRESLHFTVAASALNASAIQEGRVAVVWFSDTQYDEWDIAGIKKTSGTGSTYDVQCTPISERLTRCGPVVADVATQNGKPPLDDGVSQMSLTDLFQTKLVDNPNVSALLPWLAVGTIDPSVLIDLEWSVSTPTAIIVAAVEAAQSAAGVPYDYRLVRNGSTSYDIQVTAVT